MAEWPLVVVKELVANSAGACEDEGTPPEITVTVDADGITVVDNGPGISEETVEGVLDFAVRVSSREAYTSPTRGAQGHALKTIVTIPFVLDGECGRVAISSQAIRHEITFRVDQICQHPVIDHQKRPAPNANQGTVTQVFLPNSACPLLQYAKTRLLQIAENYTFLNPHMTLTVDWYGKRRRIEASNPSWKKWLPNMPTCTHWYSTDRFERCVSARMALDVGADRTVREFLSEFAGLTGSMNQKKVLDATGLARVNLSALHNGDGLDHGLTGRLLEAMKRSTNTDQLQEHGHHRQGSLREMFPGAWV